MSATSLAATAPPTSGTPLSLDETGWRNAAIGLLAVRFIQGFIYWGGGSRRFIYGPQKLNPHGHWMAYKFQTAMPGALLGTGHVIAYLLNHFVLLYACVIIFSAVELIAGLMLISGFLTRAAALVTVGLSISLMLMFGWQGATCIDEWTMAAANLAMGATLALTGSGAYSLDNALLRANPHLSDKAWFRWLGGSLPLPVQAASYRNLALALFAFTVAFNVGTYSYYRGSVVTPFHGGPVSPTIHSYALSNGMLAPDGGVSFHAYLNAGTPEAPAHIVEATLLQNGTVVASWNTATLTHLPKTAFKNDFPYQQFRAGPYGIVSGMGAAATITLPPAMASHTPFTGSGYSLRLTSVNGRAFSLPLTLVPPPTPPPSNLLPSTRP
ncbi:TQO small subunit DoxD [Acidocella aromatica]|uniref:Thiosulfate dehydrogenase [quinone] large subunit n=1 Tax=Acidocella aromatica TaxID=1303579 RepID=A0A840VC17_9PROT|nr:TQO small subunit DoxD [Acidocella aromatica]MBB5373448.1 thiosulfate dehydrogenase [quinone] large subunit [Acidocella aromatica]